MGGSGAISEQSCCGIHQGTGTDAGQKRNLSPPMADPVELSIVNEVSAGALPTRIDEHIQGRCIGVRVISLDNEPFRAPNKTSRLRQARDIEPVLRKGPRPKGKHLPGSYGVKFLYVLEKEDSDVSRLGHRFS